MPSVKSFIWSKMDRLNSEKFQNLHFQAEIVILRKNTQNDNDSEFSDSHDLTLFMIFNNFHENSRHRTGYFQKNRAIHI